MVVETDVLLLVGVSTGAGALGVPKTDGVDGVVKVLSLVGEAVVVTPPKLNPPVTVAGAGAGVDSFSAPPARLKPPAVAVPMAGTGVEALSPPPKLKPPAAGAGAWVASESLLSPAPKLNSPLVAGAGVESFLSPAPKLNPLVVPPAAGAIEVAETEAFSPIPKLKPPTVSEDAGAGVFPLVAGVAPKLNEGLSVGVGAGADAPPNEKAGIDPPSLGVDTAPKEKEGPLLFAFLEAPCSEPPKLTDGADDAVAVAVAGAVAGAKVVAADGAPKEKAGLLESLFAGAPPNEKPVPTGAGALELLVDPKLNAIPIVDRILSDATTVSNNNIIWRTNTLLQLADVEVSVVLPRVII